MSDQSDKMMKRRNNVSMYCTVWDVLFVMINPVLDKFLVPSIMHHSRTRYVCGIFLFEGALAVQV